MNKQKWILAVVVLAAIGITGFWMIRQSDVLSLIKVPDKAQTKSPEYVKMSKIIDQYKTADLEVIVDGYHRKPAEFLNFARLYLNRYFDPKMTAETWVKTYTYRSKLGEIIYFKYPDGSTKPMRDVFLEELKKADTA